MMKNMNLRAVVLRVHLLVIAIFLTLGASNVQAQHEADILGVQIGMDVPTALQSVFVNAHRKPGQERPDSKRNEGKDNKDVRVLYKNLEVGNLQIVFAEGKWVKEIVLEYSKPLRYEDLHLLDSSNTYANMSGVRYDDRYSVGFTSDKKLERYWWRDEKMPEGYRIRIGFVSGKLTVAGAIATKEIVRKIISITPDDESKFEKAMVSKSSAQ